jgi:hypothetical protein
VGKPLNSLRLATAALAATIALAPAAAQAKMFYVLQSGPDAWTVMDPDAIEKTPGSQIRKAWTVRVQRNILSGDPPQPGYVRTLTEYDCETERTRWREFSAFSRAGGLLVSKVNPQPDWGSAIDAYDTYVGYRIICEGIGGGSVVSADSVAKIVINLMGSWDPPVGVFAPLAPAPGLKAAPAPKTPPAKAASPKAAAPAAKPAPKL